MCKTQQTDVITKKTLDISNILEKFGKYQVWQNSLACLPAVFVSMLSVNYVFVAGDVNYRCRVSECDSTDPVFSPAWWPDTSVEIDRCTKPVLNTTTFALDSVCTNNSFIYDVEVCTDWVYENNDTIVAELNLGCQPWKVNFVGTIHGVGMIVAMIVSGWMCDRFGRKPTLILCAVGCIVGNLKVLATSYKMYIFLEFVEGAITMGVYTAASVIMSENSTQKTRVAAGVLFAYAIYLGEALFAVIGMYVHYWKNLLYIICTPPILFLSYIYLLNESPRWQILKGKMTESRKTLTLMVKTNKLNIDVREVEGVSDDKLKKIFNLENSVQKEGYKEIFKSKDIVKRLVAGIVWRLAVSFIYYSLVVNSVLLPGDKYTNFLMTALTSFPGELISMYLMNKIGRKTPLMVGFLICALTCVVSAYVPETEKWTKIALFLIGKLLVSACYTGAVVYTMELFPTSVRGSCISLCTLASCAGSMLAPLTPALSLISPVLSSFCYAGFAVLASALLLITPETKELPLMDTIDQIVMSSNRKTKKEKCAEKECENKGKNESFSISEMTSV